MNKQDLKDILAFAKDRNLHNISFSAVCEMWDKELASIYEDMIADERIEEMKNEYNEF